MSRVPDSVRRLAAGNLDVVTSAGLAAIGFDPHRAAQLVRAGFWRRPYRGVFITHSGPPPWRTLARAALEYAGPGAALSHESAAVVHRFQDRLPQVIDAAVPRPRTVTPAPGIQVHRPRWYRPPDLDPRPGTLPCVAAADTVIDLAGICRRIDDVVGLVTRATRRRVTPDEIRAALDARPNAAGRRLLREILGEVRDGVESPIELRYRRDVERRHALPRAVLQSPEEVDGRRMRSDAWYPDHGVRVELDGESAHPGGRTARDTWRDNHLLLTRGDATLRYRWLHVATDPCGTAAQVVRALRRGGWSGTPAPCGPGCDIRFLAAPAA